jgi:hypothetical protein
MAGIRVGRDACWGGGGVGGAISAGVPDPLGSDPDAGGKSLRVLYPHPVNSPCTVAIRNLLPYLQVYIIIVKGTLPSIVSFGGRSPDLDLHWIRIGLQIIGRIRIKRLQKRQRWGGTCF